MYRVCIAVVDATRARLFTFQRITGDADGHGDLVEHSDLVSSARGAVPGERSSNARPASTHGGHPSHALHDHRDHLTYQVDEKFARTALAALRELIDEHATQRVVVCAAPRMLGRLRTSAPGILPADLAVEELPRNLVELPAADIRAALCSCGILSP
jgi:protein required for attachment to host cells